MSHFKKALEKSKNEQSSPDEDKGQAELGVISESLRADKNIEKSVGELQDSLNKLFVEEKQSEIKIKEVQASVLEKEEIVKGIPYQAPCSPNLPSEIKKEALSEDFIKKYDLFNNLPAKQQAVFAHLAKWAKVAIDVANQRTLVISSPLPKSGTSTLALSLALNWAAHYPEEKIVLIEGNWFTPSLNERLGWEKHPGLVDYLMDQADLKDILFYTGFNGLHIIGAGQNEMELGSLALNSPRVKNLIFGLKNLYTNQITIFDAASVFADEALSLYRPTDNFLMVVDTNKTLKDDLRAASVFVKKQRLNVLGMVLNKFDN